MKCKNQLKKWLKRLFSKRRWMLLIPVFLSAQASFASGQLSTFFQILINGWYFWFTFWFAWWCCDGFSITKMFNLGPADYDNDGINYEDYLNDENFDEEPFQNHPVSFSKKFQNDFLENEILKRHKPYFQKHPSIRNSTDNYPKMGGNRINDCKAFMSYRTGHIRYKSGPGMHRIR